MNISSQLPLKSNCAQKQPSSCFFNIAVLNICSNSLENTCDGVQLPVNLHVTLCCFWPLLQKCYISSHHFVEQLHTIFYNTLTLAKPQYSYFLDLNINMFLSLQKCLTINCIRKVSHKKVAFQAKLVFLKKHHPWKSNPWK